MRASKPANFKQRARQDIERQQKWYFEQGAFDAALRFGDAVVDVIESLLKMPGTGRLENSPKPSLLGMRSVAIPGFESLRMYYLDTQGELSILRILHVSRDVGSILMTEGVEPA